MSKAEINKKNNAFRAELRAAMERQGIHNWRDLIRRWGLSQATGYSRIRQPETITVRELRVLVAILRMDDAAKARLAATL